MRFFAISAAAAVAGVLAGCASAPEKPAEPAFSNALYRQAADLAGTMEFLNTNYVDAGKVGYDRLMAAALRGMLRELDPYSDYEPPAEFENNEELRTGEHVGIGVEAVKAKDAPAQLTGVAPGSPAAAAGLRPGDRILRVGAEATGPLSLEDAIQLLKGPEGTGIDLEVQRDGEAEPRKLTLKRARIVRDSAPATAARMLGDGIGYLRIESFNSHTPGEVTSLLEKLHEAGMTAGLVIDLRNNPGGLVDGAVGVASLFLPEGSTVLSTRQRHAEESKEVKTVEVKTRELTLPVVILVNPFTASAAEIFSGALQDHNRAKLVGMNTFGKGTLLRVAPLSNGGALRFASGRYLTPNGREIEGKGLRPDRVVMLSVPDLWALNERLGKGETGEDAQLEAAQEMLKNRQ